jgi:hypothetical protein
MRLKEKYQGVSEGYRKDEEWLPKTESIGGV